MSRAKWKFTPREIKRAVEAVQRSGLPVSGVRVSDNAIYVETRSTELPKAGPIASIRGWARSDVYAAAQVCARLARQENGPYSLLFPT